MVIAMLLLFFTTPFFLKWHHVLLIVFWNSCFDFVFLPGTPHFWLVFAVISFAISFLNHIVFQKQFLRAPELTRPLLFLAAVVLFTAWYRGGIGIRALGGATYGGRYYVFILIAILGYFALTALPIPIAKGVKMAGLFLVSGVTYALSNIAYTLGTPFYFLYYVVPSALALQQVQSDYGLTNVNRITSLQQASIAALCFLLARYGIRGLLDWTKPWRLLFLLLTVVAALFAGFRSEMLLLFLIFAFQFYFEGLMRTRFLPIVVGLAICGFAPFLFFASSMPPIVQRAVSFLPVNVDSEILDTAKETETWRFDMWAVVAKEMPKYLFIGKGYGADPTEMFLVNEANRLGMAASGFEAQLLTGDYHSGPLSVIIPFGIPGAAAFLWVLIAGCRVLFLNRRFGDARLSRINNTLLSTYLAYGVSFFLIYGALYSDLSIFLGLCGFSVSLNGGVRRSAAPKRKPIPARQTLAMEPGRMSV
jgi:hypothetical protein